MTAIFQLFSERQRGMLVMPPSRLSRKYDLAEYYYYALKKGRNMQYDKAMRIFGIAIALQDSQQARFAELIRLLDIQRDQDIAEGGPDASPFTSSLADLLTQFIEARAEILANNLYLDHLCELQRRAGNLL